MGKTPFPPFVYRPLPDKVGAGMDRGNSKRTGSTTWHTMVGTLKGSDAWFRLAWVKAATHWGIGGSLDNELDGVIYQWVKMGGPLIPWGSGPWNYPGYGDGLRFVENYGVFGINGNSDSIEFSGQVATPMTMSQWQKGIWLTAAILHDGGRDSEQYLWNMHHREFCTPGYKDCCFARIYNHTLEYQSGIVKIMQHYEGKAMREEFVIINKIRVPLPLFQGTQPTVPATDKPIFVSFPKPRRAVLWVATARQYGNTNATIYHTYKEGSKLWFDGYYHGQSVSGDDRWYVVDSDRRERIHSTGIKEWLPDNPETNTRFSLEDRESFPRSIDNRLGAGPHWV